ncbi:MAG: GNAT family N-acetyltransferase [Sphingobacteriia bacterium]|nr:GNAT family N-acetyltransferase [Sphingobacteriia bacterium]
MLDSFSYLLIPANLDSYELIQNMARFYVYDISRYCGFLPGWELPTNGLYECFDLKNYLTDSDRYAFIIKINNEKAGFILLNKIGSTSEVDWNIGEFFILAKFQGLGIGKKIAFEIFNKFKGKWEVAVIPENKPALQFWRKIIFDYTNNNFSESRKTVEYPIPHPMLIFSF